MRATRARRYLDNTFCAQFRLLNESIDATLLMQFIVWGVWSVSFLTLFMRVAQIFFYVFRFGYKVGLRRAVQAQARDMLYTYVLVFFLISPPIIWFKIFIPCLTCYDFEATAAHELGHVLGFTHTDSFPENNRVETERFSADVCAYSQGVPDKSGSVVGIDAEFAGIEDSIMFHLTTKKSKCAPRRRRRSGRGKAPRRAVAPAPRPAAAHRRAPCRCACRAPPPPPLPPLRGARGAQGVPVAKRLPGPALPLPRVRGRFDPRVKRAALRQVAA